MNRCKPFKQTGALLQPCNCNVEAQIGCIYSDLTSAYPRTDRNNPARIATIIDAVVNWTGGTSWAKSGTAMP